MPDTTSPVGEILSARDVADYLGLAYVTVLRLLKAGELPGRKVGGSWRTRRVDLDQRLRPSTRQDVDMVSWITQQAMQDELKQAGAGVFD